jgi:3-hydroxyisobutyrate dehydrogenase
VESVIFDGNVAAAFAEGSVWAQMGTIGVEATLGCRDRLAAARPGVTFVDAPVSGSKGPAEQGQLLVLASGPETAAGPLRPVFDAIGRKTVWLGQVGQGSIVKLVVNAYLSILIEGVAETMELADRLGIGHQQLADVIEGGPLDAPLAGAKLHKMARQRDRTGDRCRKDVARLAGLASDGPRPADVLNHAERAVVPVSPKL